MPVLATRKRRARGAALPPEPCHVEIAGGAAPCAQALHVHLSRGHSCAPHSTCRPIVHEAQFGTLSQGVRHA